MKAIKLFPSSSNGKRNKFFKFNNRTKLLFITKKFNSRTGRKKLRNGSREIFKQDIWDSAKFPSLLLRGWKWRNSQEVPEQKGKEVASRDVVKKVDCRISFCCQKLCEHVFNTHLDAEIQEFSTPLTWTMTSARDPLNYLIWHRHKNVLMDLIFSSHFAIAFYCRREIF